MWSVRCVRTRQVRPLATAEWTSPQICAVRRSSATSAVNTDWMSARSSSLTSVVVWWTTSSRRTSSAPATVPGLISWRIGPQWNPMIASSLSRRYGVAVRPSHRRVRARSTHAANETAGRWWHSSTTTSPYRSNIDGSSRRARLWSIATSTTPVGLSLPPPIWPISFGARPRCSARRDRHWSTSSLRSTTHEGRCAVVGDHGAGHHGLAGAGRGDEDAAVVTDEIADRCRLLRSELADETERRSARGRRDHR